MCEEPTWAYDCGPAPLSADTSAGFDPAWLLLAAIIMAIAGFAVITDQEGSEVTATARDKGGSVELY